MEQKLSVSLLSDRENNPSTLPEILKSFDHVSHFIDMLLPFCELAFTDLMSAETKLVFHKGQLERQLGKSRVDLAHRLGLISQSKVRSDIGRPQNVSVSFYHKSVQELLAAMYMTCWNRDAVALFCRYCSTLDKVMETGHVLMFLMGLNPPLGCRICEHITNVVNSDTQIQQYRRTLDDSSRSKRLFHAQLEWYREMIHCRTVTGDMSPPPSLHVGDIYLDHDSDTVRLTEEVVSTNLDTIMSVNLLRVRHPLHRVLDALPRCPQLSALCITHMDNKENHDHLVAVIPRLTQLDTIKYVGTTLSTSAVNDDVKVVNAILQLTQLRSIVLVKVDLGDGGGLMTSDMTRLQTVGLNGLNLLASNWDRFVSSLLSLPQTVDVRLIVTNIGGDTVRMILTSPRITVTRDDGKSDEKGKYALLYFTTRPA